MERDAKRRAVEKTSHTKRRAVENVSYKETRSRENAHAHTHTHTRTHTLTNGRETFYVNTLYIKFSSIRQMENFIYICFMDGIYLSYGSLHKTYE